MKVKLAVILAAVCCQPAHADLLVAKGRKAVLSVEYIYESNGRKQDKYDLHEWRVKRSASLTAELAAEAPSPLPAMHAMDSAQTADLQGKTARAQGAQQKMQPMMADIEKLMAQCGDDDACIERGVMEYGSKMQMTPQLKSAGEDIAAASRQGASRYQMWGAAAQKGTYSIDETIHTVDADPICMELPGARCTRDETRKGAGEIPLPPGMKQGSKESAGFARLEVDATRQTMMLLLPEPMAPLPYTQTVVTDDPEGRSGSSQQLRSLLQPGSKPFLVTLKGDLREQSGEQVFKAREDAGYGGTITARWRLRMQ